MDKRSPYYMKTSREIHLYGSDNETVYVKKVDVKARDPGYYDAYIGWIGV